jgi:hypothetical protein
MNHGPKARLTMFAALLLASGCGTKVINGGPDLTGAGGGSGGDACMVAADCASPACEGKPVDCGEPAAPTCVSATTLRVATAAGICAAGACSQGHTDTEYPSGCSTAPRPLRLSASMNHTCGINSSGALECWGNYQPVTVTSLSTGVVAVATRYNQTCAVTASGEAKCWGEIWGSNPAEPDHVLTPESVTGLSSSVVALDGKCAVVSSGALECWGPPDRLAAVPMPGLSSGIVAFAGGSGSCVLTATGAVKCWGRDLEGELGDGTGIDSVVPVDVVGLSSGVVAIAGGALHTCAITAAGAVTCWGVLLENNEENTGSSTGSMIPVEVPGLSSGVAAVAVGTSHSCAVMLSGAVKCWGYNVHGQLGDGTTVASQVPVDVVGLSSGVVALAVGDRHACALLATGAVKCWGDNSTGQLGNLGGGSLVPVDVVGF